MSVWLDADGRRADCPTNEFYGHAQILRDYCGVADAAPVRGRIQHGWCPIHNAFSDAIERRGPFYAWSERAAGLARAAGAGDVHVIGAPWLYMRQQTSAPTQRDLLALPLHSIKAARLPESYWRTYADWLKDYVRGHEPTVCLHPEDYDVAAGAFSFAHAVCCGGQDFLYRLRTLLRNHRRATSPLPQTAAFYAASEGLEVQIAGPTVATSNPDEAERVLLAGFQPGGWRDELGLAAKLAPDALRRLLWGA